MSVLEPLPRRDVELTSSTFAQRRDANRRYIGSLRSDNLLQNHYFEAGLWNPPHLPEDVHGGWESPTCAVRGHFLGHWLSAAAHHDAARPDPELRGKADHVVAELARCQAENGGEWVASIPEKYLHRLARGSFVWAPGYVAGKTLMGLLEMATVAGNEQALEILRNAARWYTRFTGSLSERELADFLDYEQCNMLESVVELYALTGEEEHLELVRRYDRRRLFDALLAGDDVLTNRHANTTIPEVVGAARAYEVTGESRWREIVEAYWRLAVTERGSFVTGCQTCGEVWTPPFTFAHRLGDTNQEFCTVYNMMRLAEFLLRWTGDAGYANYRELALHNGVLAQQHAQTGMVAYYLPLQSGLRKTWTTPTESFPCCLGTMVQAISQLGGGAFYERDGALVVAQPLPADVAFRGARVEVRGTDALPGPGPMLLNADEPWSRPSDRLVELRITAPGPVSFPLELRIPEWLTGPARLTVGGETRELGTEPGFHRIEREWRDDVVRLELPADPVTVPLPDRPDTVAFRVGPVALAGLVDGWRRLHGDPADAGSLVELGDERGWGAWTPRYRTRGQERDFRLVPLADVLDEPYAVYFPVGDSPKNGSSGRA
ncbi:MAG TPA: beta-L-arabinofuranosidase domain-containing protein [Gaiellaceae bacterium]|nr:beta-L-arabinofuranosidase domain-containing protein [Gaiellaceae bacterium]